MINLQNWKVFQTLGFRLARWNTLVLLIACVFALVCVRVGMRLTIVNEAESLLQEEVLELELAIKQLSPDQDAINDEFARKVLGHSRHNWFARLGDSNRTIWQSDNLPQVVSSEIEVPTEPGTLFQATDKQLIVTHYFTMPDGTWRTIVLGEPNEFVRNDVWQLTKIMLYIGVLLLLVAPLGGFLLAQQALSPVREIISTTRSLDPAHLDSRLTIRGTGDELDQISVEINSFVDQISRYIDTQREFIANAAHELRSPIAAILASVDVTLSKERDAAEYHDDLVAVGQQCRELSFLVNQLLDLAETEGMQPAVSEAIDLQPLVQKSLDVFSAVADEKQIALNVQLEPGVIVEGDPSKLFQVVNNLVDNAIKFAPRSGRIDVRMTEHDSHAVLTVTDSGPGVPDQYLEKIFERFFQVDQARERVEHRGNGLGLSICKSILRQCGGEISAENTGQGFQIRVSIPVSS